MSEKDEIKIMTEVRPTLLIGIGGTGHEVLMNVRKKLVQHYGPLKDHSIIRFLQIDTDQGHMSESVPDPEYLGEDIRLKASEVLNLQVRGGNDLKKNQAISEWFPDQLDIEIDFNIGAAGKRNYGRLAIAVNADDIFKAIMDATTQAKDQVKCREFEQRFHVEVKEEELLVFIVCSLVGGTGSGGFLDVCYITRRVISELKNKILFGYFITGGTEADAIKKSNCYGALKELEYFSNKNLFNVRYPAKNIPVVTNIEKDSYLPPVDWCYLINGTNSVGMIFDKNTLFTLCADNIFTEITPGISNKRRSLRQDMTGEYGYKKLDKLGRPQSFITFGTSSIEFPAINLIDVFTFHLASDSMINWTFPEAVKMDVVKELDRDLEEWGLRVDKGQLEKSLATSDDGETLWVKIATKQNRDLNSCGDFLPKPKRDDLRLKVRNDLTMNSRNVDVSLDRPGDWIRTVRHRFEKIFKESVESHLKPKIYNIITNAQGGGVNNALAYLEALKTRLNVYSEQHSQKKERVQKDIVAATSRLSEEEKRFLSDIHEKDWMVKSHLEAVYKASSEVLRKMVESEVHERAIRLLIGRRDSKGGWQEEGLLAEVERLEKLIKDTFQQRLKDVANKFRKSYEENRNKVTSPTVTTEVMITQAEIDEIYKKIIPNSYLASIEVKNEVEYAMGEGDTPRNIFLCIIEKIEETADLVLKIVKKRFTGIKEISVAERLSKLSQDDTKQRLGTAYKKAYPLLYIDMATRQRYCSFNPEKTTLNMIGIIDPTKDEALMASNQVMQSIGREVQNPFILPLLPDRYRIVFCQEVGGFSLKCVDAFTEYRDIYRSNTGGEMKNLFQTDKRIIFPDLFPPEEEDLKKRLKEPLILSKALGIFERRMDPITEEEYYYYFYDDIHGSHHFKLGRKWEEVEEFLFQTQKDKEINALSNDQTPLQLIEEEIHKKGSKAISLSDRENVWLILEKYLVDLKGKLKGGELNPKYQEENEVIKGYREKYRLFPPKNWQKGDDPEKWLQNVLEPLKERKESFENCPKCGTTLQEGFKKCPGCGFEIGVVRKTCPKCGKVMEPSWKVCPYC